MTQKLLNDVALSGFLAASQASVTAAGTTRDTATLLTSQFSRITAGSPGLGNAVRLPNDRPAGELWAVTNTVEAYNSNSFNIWAGTTASGGLFLIAVDGTSSIIGVRGQTTVLFISLGSNLWLAFSHIENSGPFNRLISADGLRINVNNIRLEGASYANFGIATMFTGALSHARIVTQKTAGYLVNADTDNNSDRGRLFTNEGASAQVILTLPSASMGLTYSFAVHAAFNLRVLAAAGDIIRIAGNVGTAGGFTESAVVGSVIRLTALNAVDWFAELVTGTWNPPT